MSAVEPLCLLFGINPRDLSKEEVLLLEAELTRSLCKELKATYRKQYRSYFRLMKYTEEMEKSMIDKNFLRFVINDILVSEEYTLSGIALYTATPEEVIEEIASGANTEPTVTILERVIEIHRLVRRNLYDTLIKKIFNQYAVIA